MRPRGGKKHNFFQKGAPTRKSHPQKSAYPEGVTPFFMFFEKKMWFSGARIKFQNRPKIDKNHVEN